MTPLASAIEFALKKIARCERAIESLAKLVNGRTICQDCDGEGQVRRWVAQDETEPTKCEPCKGTGVTPKKTKRERE